MRIPFIFLLICCFSLHAEETSVVAAQAEAAQNLLEKTFSRMNHAWNQMKFHFHEGNEKVKEEAKKSMAPGYGKTKSAGKSEEERVR